jgi:iron-sulfur cluster assembly protein
MRRSWRKQGHKLIWIESKQRTFASPKRGIFVAGFPHMIKVNDNARDQVQRLLAEEGRPAGSFVRVGVKGGGCSGLMYQLDFDHVMNDDDQSFEDNGVKVVVDKKSFLYLVGTELRYSGGLNGKGFEFHNPNANRTCGCGESFSL